MGLARRFSIAVLLVSIGCDPGEGVQPEGPDLLTLDSVQVLPRFDLSISETRRWPRPADGFVYPAVLGSPAGGVAYVYDAGQRRIAGYDFVADTLAILARAGRGPGEFSQLPDRLGTLQNSIWFSEFGTGIVHSIALDGRIRTTRRSGWNHFRSGVDGVAVVPLSENDDMFLVELVRIQQSATVGGLSDWVVELRVGTSEDSNVIYEATIPSPRMTVDGGRTVVTTSIPDLSPYFVYDERRNRIVVVDQELGDEQWSSVGYRVFSTEGSLVMRQRFRVPAKIRSDQSIAAARAVLRDRLTQRGSRPLSSALEDALQTGMEGLPPNLPVFDDAFMSADGEVWLRLGSDDTAEDGDRWMILDVDGSPRALVTVPLGVTKLWVGVGGQGWATRDARELEPFLVEFSAVAH